MTAGRTTTPWHGAVITALPAAAAGAGPRLRRSPGRLTAPAHHPDEHAQQRAHDMIAATSSANIAISAITFRQLGADMGINLRGLLHQRRAVKAS